MAPAVLLLVAACVFRGLGAFGVDLFATWLDSARVALALTFLFTASAHFTCCGWGQTVGATLVGLGALTTVPALFALFGRRSNPHPDLLIVS